MTIIAALMLNLLASATTDGAPAGTDCYDVVVRARIVDQIPSDLPDCDDCIIMAWPWFLDLKVAKVVEGHLDAKMVRVLAVAHTYHRTDYVVWKLRRNAIGGFNVVQPDDGLPPARCTSDAPLPAPYLRPSPDKTLEDMRNQGIEHYGHYPKR